MDQERKIFDLRLRDGEKFGTASESSDDIGIVFSFDERDDGLSDAVSRIARICVGAIETKGDGAFLEIAFDLVPRNHEERSDERRVRTSEWRESKGTGSAEEIEEDGFGYIVLRVSGDDIIKTIFLPHSLEESVAEIAEMFFGIFFLFDPRRENRNRHVKFFGGGPNQVFIGQ